MWFETRILKTDEIRSAGIKFADSAPGKAEWYAYVHAKLLDRIEFEVTNHGAVSQSADSIVIASRTDPSFDKAGPTAMAGSRSPRPRREGSGAGKHPYSGGISYAKISRCASSRGSSRGDAHGVRRARRMVSGAPMLRSKFSVAAQDQIRTLRRELIKKRAK